MDLDTSMGPMGFDASIGLASFSAPMDPMGLDKLVGPMGFGSSVGPTGIDKLVVLVPWILIYS